MRRRLFTPLARRDLDDIWQYSAKRWGEDQAEVYLRHIDVATRRIAENPSIARLCDDVREGYRVLLCASHNIYFRTTKDAVVIVRILHTRMDPDRNL